MEIRELARRNLSSVRWRLRGHGIIINMALEHNVIMPSFELIKYGKICTIQVIYAVLDTLTLLFSL